MYFDTDGLVMRQDQDSKSYIPMEHCRIIYDNLCKGMFYKYASPVYDISREQAAYILTHFSSD